MYDPWDDMAKQSIRFFKQHDRLPGEGDLRGEEELDQWLSQQRRASQQRRLARRQSEYLDRQLPGWRRSIEDRWRSHLDDVIKARVEGQPLDDTSREWLRQQRRALTNGSLQENRKKALDESLPHWAESSDVRWKAHADELLAYVTAHGCVPQYTQGDSPEAVLYRWLNYQRYLLKAGKLRPERQAWLDENTPGWCPEEATRDGAWMHRAQAALRFVRRTGDLPSTIAQDCERSMARWFETQRAAQRRGKLQEDRARWLDKNIPGWNADRRKSGGTA